MIVNPFVSVAVCRSGFVTTTFHVPVALPVRSKVAVRLRQSPATATPVPGMSSCPLRVSFTAAPLPTRFPTTDTVTAAALPPVAGCTALTSSTPVTRCA